MNGTYYGKGDFGSIKVVVKENNKYINYYLDFKDNYVKQILKEKRYRLTFVANKELNMEVDTSRYTKEIELLYRGIFASRITKPFTLLKISVGSQTETVKLTKQ